MNSIEIFAGAGGLAMGVAKAGFRHVAVIEQDAGACDTFRLNQRHHFQDVNDWPLQQIDARKFNYTTVNQGISLISGGPPCQPFSQGGKHSGHVDNRNMFPEAIRAVREIMPKAFIFENVKGLAREKFISYFSYIIDQLQYPEIFQKQDEDWISHHRRLERHRSSSKLGTTYNVVFELLNAADYGIPQKRERVFIVGFRSDLGKSWAFPPATHSEDALLFSKWVTGHYWDKHKIALANRAEPNLQQRRRLASLTCSNELSLSLQSWKTIRDALSGLPDPELSDTGAFMNHEFKPGARTYPGHSGSALDVPAKTLKAGQHGVPGGENMLVKDDGTARYFTVREAARLQTFPDEYEFPGAWSQTMRQLGNAVPVILAEIIARSIAISLDAN